MNDRDAVLDDGRLLRRVIDQLFAFVGLLEIDGTLIQANETALARAGLTIEDVRGRKFWDCHWWAHDSAVQARLADAVKRAAHGETVRYDVDVRMVGDVLITIDFQLSPLLDRDGRVQYLVPSGVDVSDRVGSERALRIREAEARRATAEIEAVYALAPVGMCVVDRDGRYLRVNALLAEINGVPASDHIGRTLTEIVPSLAEPAQKLVDHIVRTGETLRDIELTGETAANPGVQRCWLEHWSPLHDETGQVVAVNVVAEEITERKERERQMEFAVNELAHRSKNLMAVVQAIMRQTARTTDSVDDFFESLESRIGALARANDLLTAQNWKGTVLADLVRTELRTFADEHRIVIDGPPVTLSARTTQHLSLALHELATNACKHGALSTPGGTVTVSWLLTEGPDMELRVRWQERGGPRVAPPQRVGFGSRVLKDMAGAAVGGSTELEYAEDGVVWTLRCKTSTCVID